ncbi:MAG: cytochrome P450, partial [Acidobacteriota bacterium]
MEDAGAGDPDRGALRLSLHGLLQQVPIAALPLPDGSFWGTRFHTPPIPAATPVSGEVPTGSPPAATVEPGRGIFVLDPLGDLAGARRQLPFYRALTDTPVLMGSAATVAAVERAAADVDWLHVDGHGRFDAAFPELSALLLADGALDLAKLAQLRAVPDVVNLSGCRTGAWPRTADSGRYGLGGLLIRRGASWVIASAADLDNRLAADFNRVYYGAFFEGVGVACAMDEMITATFEVVCDALLSGGVYGDGETLDRREIGDAINRYLDTIGRVSLLDIVGAPEWVPRPAALLNRSVMDGTIAMIDAMIAARRAAYDAGERRDDLIDYLLAATDPETGRTMGDATLRNNLISFIVAGHESTALALAWALYLVANDRAVQDRAADEAQAALGAGRAARAADATDLSKLGYIRQILDEAMRLYPPAAMLGRTARGPDQI